MDEIDELLTPRPMPASRSDAAWQNTRGVLRRRRWVRRGGQVVLMALVFAAGALTYRSMNQPVLKPTQTELAQLEQPKAKTEPVDPFRNAAPDKIERFANMADGEKRLELYRRAGDTYLQRGDELGALRCYRQALDGGGPAEMVVREQDSWLMMSLKLARQKERIQ
jgi:type VI protein secretion system component VasK